ncbi:MAG TPA: GNAT family N-acetyltransferase [Stellaceae bacterium]|jgi:GNAT superfamily N-acetyltransferase|nr:GNAT family N-acetyltransferase [Stellaceae bacterium]
MLRPAIAADLPALVAIRDHSGADALSDPARVHEALLCRLIDSAAVVAWDDEGVSGFAATDGAVVHLLVDSALRGGGIGRALLDWACAAVREAGHAAAIVTLTPGSTAERHYRAAGWVSIEAGAEGHRVFQKPL